jgi:3-oxoacyl-[acyl-carrier-protein] synthase-3
VDAYIAALEYFLPLQELSTEQISALHPQWSAEKIDAKTGIKTRHLAAGDQHASDLALAAARKLFQSGVCEPSAIDFILLCTQTPDFAMPTTACLLQHQLGVPSSAGALDINLACSGFIYGLGLAKGLIISGQARCLLLLTANTLSKFIDPNDRNSATIFGDGASATLVLAGNEMDSSIGPLVYGTNGQDGLDIVVLNSGTRTGACATSRVTCPSSEKRDRPRFIMNGKKVFDFVLDAVPKSVTALLQQAQMRKEDIDLFVFHQANAFILEELRRLLELPKDKFQITIGHCGNTSSSSIPIALKHAQAEGKLPRGARVMLVGFGAGYSWGAAMLRWRLE